MPEWPLPLLGQDLLCKLSAQVTFSENFVQFHIPPKIAWKAQIYLLTDLLSEEAEESIPNTVLDMVIPLVWASKKPGKAKNVTQIKLGMEPGARLVMVNQYPIRLEAHKGLDLLMNTFMQYGLFR